MAALTETNGFTVNPEYPGWGSLGETQQFRREKCFPLVLVQ